MEATYVLRPYEEKGSYKEKIKGGEATFYPCKGRVNGAFDVEAGYLLITGDREKLEYEPGYYRYIKVNLNGEPFFRAQKISDDTATQEIENLKSSRIDIIITPRYKDLKEDDFCKDFVAKGINVEKKNISFKISASHMSELPLYDYGDFYFANAASFHGYKVKSPGMVVTIDDIVNSKKNYYFVCTSYEDEKGGGSSLVVRGLLEGENLMFLKIPEEKERIWENIFEIYTAIDKYYSLAVFSTNLPTGVTPLSISNTMRNFCEDKMLSREEDPIIFSTR